MRKKSLLLLLFLFSASFAFSQTAEPGPEPETSPCPNPKKLRGFCGMVNNRITDPSNANEYLYQTRLLEASCVSDDDSEEIKNKKVREAWLSLENELVCDSSQFDVLKGNVLKFAASTKFEEFIKDAIRWNVNLNRVDPSDERTVLDYVQDQAKKHRGNALEAMFKHYYKLLRDAGAKHKSEL